MALLTSSGVTKARGLHLQLDQKFFDECREKMDPKVYRDIEVVADGKTRSFTYEEFLQRLGLAPSLAWKSRIDRS